MLWTRCPRCWEPPAASQPCAALPATLNSRKGEREGENKRKKDKGGMQTHRLQCWKLPAGITGASSQEGEFWFLARLRQILLFCATCPAQGTHPALRVCSQPRL